MHALTSMRRHSMRGRIPHHTPTQYTHRQQLASLHVEPASACPHSKGVVGCIYVFLGVRVWMHVHGPNMQTSMYTVGLHFALGGGLPLLLGPRWAPETHNRVAGPRCPARRWQAHEMAGSDGLSRLEHTMGASICEYAASRVVEPWSRPVCMCNPLYRCTSPRAGTSLQVLRQGCRLINRLLMKLPLSRLTRRVSDQAEPPTTGRSPRSSVTPSLPLALALPHSSPHPMP